MPDSRVQVLRQMLEQDPSSSFARYGLAMELVKSNNLEAAIGEFNQLILNSPDYAAAYFHGGQTLEKLGRVDEARSIYAKGIEVTTRTGDAHTRSELQAALDILG